MTNSACVGGQRWESTFADRLDKDYVTLSGAWCGTDRDKDGWLALGKQQLEDLLYGKPGMLGTMPQLFDVVDGDADHPIIKHLKGVDIEMTNGVCVCVCALLSSC